MFSTPVANSNSAPPTSSRIEMRSSACAAVATGGHANSLGMTDHSLASSTGIAISPIVTCRPWVSAYSHAGLPAGSGDQRADVPAGRHDGVGADVGLVLRSARSARSPRRSAPGPAASTRGARSARRPRSGLRQNPGRNGPGGARGSGSGSLIAPPPGPPACRGPRAGSLALCR